MAKYSMVLSRGVTIYRWNRLLFEVKNITIRQSLCNRKKDIRCLFVPKDVFTIDHNVSVCLEGFNRNLCEEYNGPNLSKSAGSTPV